MLGILRGLRGFVSEILGEEEQKEDTKPWVSIYIKDERYK